MEKSNEGKKQKDRALVMTESPKLAIYGGSFSPVHTGHVLAARAFLSVTDADKLIIMPARRPPHKSLDGMISDSQRVDMCRLAFETDGQLCGKCEVSTFELERDSVSYTVDTIEHFRFLGYEDISLLVGTDMLLSFERWYRFADILSYVTLCYVDRSEDMRERTRKHAEYLESRYGARVIAIDADVFEVSSSEIRELIADGKSITGLVGEKVEEYIIKNGLYK